MNFGIYPNLGKENLKECLQKLCGALEDRGMDYAFPLSMKEGLSRLGFGNGKFETIEELGNRNIIFSVGGDGSFLGAARTFRNYPVLMAGVHLGELGFLNSITCGELDDRLSLIFRGDFEVESRLFLSATLVREDGKEETLPDVLNDVVVGHSAIGQLARIRLSINHHFIQEYAADGLIISTPTGSTGYSLSCGGPVLGPSAKEIIVVPVCAHTLQRFSMVLKDQDLVEITAPEREKSLMISLDGACSHAFSNRDHLFIRAIHKPLRFIRFRDQDFFGTITRKLVRKIVEN